MKPLDTYYVCNNDFPHRYIDPKKLFQYLENNFGDEIELLGTSVNNLPIYKMRIGDGKIKVVAWSQMHGNESNSTLAMLDFLKIKKLHPLLFKDLFQEITLDFVFMLNPDGALLWKRRNLMDVDMNRDFHQEASKELALLKQLILNNHYDYAFNLHEQRTIFSSDGEHPATMCFLAPSEDVNKTITPVRKQTMAVISSIYSQLKTYLPYHISRYNDDFYPLSTGDNFTKLGIPTILFEGGHYPNDYLRKETRKYYTYAFYYGLKAVSALKGSDDNWELYHEIPNNQNTHYDVIYRHINMNTDFKCHLDIAVQYQEVIMEGAEEISFEPIIAEIGDLSGKKGWKEIDCTNKKITYKSFPQINEKINFEIN